MSPLKDELTKYFKKKEKVKPPYERVSELGLKLLSDEKLEARTRLINLLHEEFDKPIDQVLQDTYSIPLNKQTPEDYVKVLRDRLHILNRLMKVVSVPYGRAGEEMSYRLMMRGWELLYSLALDITGTVENIVKATETNGVEISRMKLTEKDLETRIEQLVQTVKDGGQVEATSLAQKLVGQSIDENATQTLMTLKINIEELIRKLESFLQVEIYPYGFLIMSCSYFDKDVAPAYATIIESYRYPQRQIPFGYGPGLRPQKKEE